MTIKPKELSAEELNQIQKLNKQQPHFHNYTTELLQHIFFQDNRIKELELELLRKAAEFVEGLKKSEEPEEYLQSQLTTTTLTELQNFRILHAKALESLAEALAEVERLRKDNVINKAVDDIIESQKETIGQLRNERDQALAAIEVMREALKEARHELKDSAWTHIKQIVEKIDNALSKTPPEAL